MASVDHVEISRSSF